jgi:copper chaperone CopZ
MEQVPNSDEQQYARPQIRTPSERLGPNDTYVTTVYVTNIHCQSCVSYATDILRLITGVIRVDISIAHHSIRIEHHGDIASKIRKELTDASFEVQHLKMSDSNGVLVHEYNLQPFARRVKAGLLLMREAHKRHLDNCNACKAQAANEKRTSAGEVSRCIYRSRMNVSDAPTTSATCDNFEDT